MKKYKLTKETKENLGIKFYRIEAVRDFGDVEKGEKGGWIEREGNLSHNGNAWVHGDARVYGNARVFDNARVFGNARVSGNAWVHGDARVSGNVWVHGKLRCETGYYFAHKEKDWDITEVELEGDGILLVKDYKPPAEKKEDEGEMVEIDGKKWSKGTIKEALKKHAS